MIAWGVARTVAGTVAGDGSPGPPLPGDLAELGRRAQDAVVAYTRLEPARALPVPEAVGRGAWSEANIGLLREMLAPVAGKLEDASAAMPGAARSVVGGAVGAEIGAVIGYMGRRVLGQYEVALVPGEPPPDARLLLVAPNLREAADRLGAELEPLLAWVMVHEVTHAVQFSAVPWLRGHLGGLVAELLASADVRVNPGSLSLPDLGDVRAFWERAKDGGLLAVAGPARGDLLDRMQATMALIEGHAEHVMDAAGAPLVPGLAELRAGLERRRDERSPLATLLQKLLGLDLKLRQYREGKAFCDQVVAMAGVGGLNRAFADAEHLPSMRELADPLGWLARTEPRALPA